MEDINKLEKEVESWSLACDMKLLTALREYSQSLSQRASQLVEKVDDLGSEVMIEDTRLRNMFNEFMIMSNTQFIENRVYDDDDDDDDTSTREEKSSSALENMVDPVVLMKKAFNAGFEALKLFYDDEMGNESKQEDVYNLRPLPYLIGTDKFQKSIDGGLGDIVESVDEPEIPTKMDTSSHPVSSTFDQKQAIPPPPQMVSSYRLSNDNEDEEASQTEDNSFQSQPSNSQDLYRKPPPPPPPTASLSAMLSAQIKSRTQNIESSSNQGNPKEEIKASHEKPEDLDSGTESQGDTFADKKKIASQIFASKPGPPPPRPAPPAAVASKPEENEEDEEEEDDDIFQATNEDPYSLFGSGGTNRKSMKRDSFAGLFGDIPTRDRSDSMSSTGSSSRSSIVGTMKRKPSISALFGDSNDDSLFDEIPDTSKDKTIAKPNLPPQEELPKPVKPNPSKGLSDLFGDAIDTIEKPKDSTKSKPAIRSMGASDLFSGGLFDSNDDQVSSKPGPSGASKNISTSSKFASLFGDDDAGDSLFGEPKSKPLSKQSQSDVVKESAKPISVAAAPKKPPSSLFDDDEEDEDSLFKSKPKPSVAPQTTSGAAPSSVSAPPLSQRATLKSLFDDDDDDDTIFAKKPSLPVQSSVSQQSSSKPVEATKPVSSLFEDSDPKLFANTKKPSNASGPAAILTKADEKPLEKKEIAQKTKSLFDDDVSDPLFESSQKSMSKISSVVDTGAGDDIASANAPVVHAVQSLKKETNAKTTSLFEDDDIIISKPNVDATSSKVSLVSNAASEPAPNQSESDSTKVSSPLPISTGPQSKSASSSAKTTSLFEDDDLIISKPNVDATSSKVSLVSNAASEPAPNQSESDSTKVSSPLPISTGPQSKSASSSGPLKIPLPNRPVNDSDESDNDESDREDAKKVSKPLSESLKFDEPKQAIVPQSSGPINMPETSKKSDFPSSNTSSTIDSIKSAISIDPSKMIPGARPNSMKIPLPPRPQSSDDDSDESDNETSKPVTTQKIDHIAIASSSEAQNTAEPSAVATDNKSKLNSSPGVRTSKHLGEGLAARLANLDPSKIIMPGMTHPRGMLTGSNITPSTSDSRRPSSDSTSTSTHGDSQTTEISVAANLDRAIVSNKSRRAPTKKSSLLFNDESDALSPIESPKATDKSTDAQPQTTVPLSDKSSNKSLFDDSSEAALFSKPTVPSPLLSEAHSESLTINPSNVNNQVDELFSKPVVQSAPVPSQVNIDSAPISTPTVLSEKPKGLISKSLFDDEGDLFGNPTTVKSAPSSSSSVSVNQETKKSSIFGDDDDDSFLVPAPKKTVKTEPSTSQPKKSSLFDDADDDSLFGGKAKDVSKVSEKKIVKKSSLFGDDDEDDPLFGKTSKPAATKRSSLFDD